ncbi:putative salutaridinol 7-O-acetyltransferase-like [Capsicum annuum]|nr:putative salutaridinol 7-O-acetyltransferase-like [Capsicum annuum]
MNGVCDYKLDGRLGLHGSDCSSRPEPRTPTRSGYLPGASEEGLIITERCDKLQKSLAQTLTKYYPLAGRFEEDNELLIYCNDEGVEYVETKVNADLDEFIHQGVPKSIELLNDLLPEMDHVPSSPLLGVQVNVINCGGLVIEIRMSHILADAFTFATFVKEWAHICQGMGQQKIASHVLVNCHCSFPREYYQEVLAGISSAKNGHPRDSRLFFPINLRGKSYLPSLKHALGNFFVNVVATLEANKSRKELNDFVKSGRRFPWYEADFGWGKPFWVSSVSFDIAEIVCLMDTKNSDGIEVWVSLKENVMAEFEKHPDILAFCPPLQK